MAKGSGGGGSGPTVAKAYVAIIPTTKDAQKNISKSLIPEMESASDDAGKAGGESLVGSLGSALSAGVSKVAAAAKVVAGAGVAALGALTTAAYGAFSDWEQLSGGVKTIFGDAAADTVIANAKRAFGTVQMSANAYLDTVTSFSASLIQSLGGDTEAAAHMADMAVSDMADNANKMGSDIASIQVAYQGFAKQNFSMLDNLKLGYGGTQQEMYRLLQDAASLNEEFAQTADFSIDDKGHLTASFADITKAIHIIQQEWGIAGASADEAATTLEGSFNMMSASWQNLLVAFGEGTTEAIKPAVDSLISSVGIWLKNAIPRIGIIISGIVSYLPTLARDIIAALPGIVSDISNALVEQVGSIDLSSMLGPMMDGAMENGLIASIVSFGGRIGEAFRAVFGEVDIESIRGAVETAMGVIMRVIQSVQMAFASLIDSIDTATIISVMEGLKQIGEALVGVLTSIGSIVADVVVGLLWPTLQGIWSFVSDIILPGVMSLWETIQPGIMMVIGMLDQVFDWISQLVSGIVSFLVPAIAMILEIAAPVIQGLMDGIGDILGALISSIAEMWATIEPFVSRVVADLSGFFTELGNWIRAVWPVVSWVANQIGQGISIVVQTITSMVSGLISGISDIIKGIIGVITGIASVIYDLITGNFDALRADFAGLVDSIGSIFWGVIEVITSPFRYAFNQIKKLWNSTIGGMNFTVPDWVPGIGGKSFGMPKLAEGGILTHGGTVMVGEAGPEILSLPSGARVAPLDAVSATSGETTYSVVVGNVDITDDDQVRRVTREYLEFLASIARPGAVAI